MKAEIIIRYCIRESIHVWIGKFLVTLRLMSHLWHMVSLLLSSIDLHTTLLHLSMTLTEDVSSV